MATQNPCPYDPERIFECPFANSLAGIGCVVGEKDKISVNYLSAEELGKMGYAVNTVVTITDSWFDGHKTGGRIIQEATVTMCNRLVELKPEVLDAVLNRTDEGK